MLPRAETASDVQRCPLLGDRALYLCCAWYPPVPQASWWVLMWTYSMSVGAAEQAVPGLAAVSVGYEHCQLTLAIGLAAWCIVRRTGC